MRWGDSGSATYIDDDHVLSRIETRIGTHAPFTFSSKRPRLRTVTPVSRRASSSISAPASESKTARKYTAQRGGEREGERERERERITYTTTHAPKQYPAQRPAHPRFSPLPMTSSQPFHHPPEKEAPSALWMLCGLAERPSTAALLTQHRSKRREFTASATPDDGAVSQLCARTRFSSKMCSCSPCASLSL